MFYDVNIACYHHACVFMRAKEFIPLSALFFCCVDASSPLPSSSSFFYFLLCLLFLFSIVISSPLSLILSHAPAWKKFSCAAREFLPLLSLSLFLSLSRAHMKFIRGLFSLCIVFSPTHLSCSLHHAPLFHSHAHENLSYILTHLRGFLVHTGFYRIFIKEFAKISKPLTNLLSKDVDFIMNDDALKAFNLIKDSLIHAPVLQAPNWDLPFERMCDASNFVVGAELGQIIDKKPVAIYYASKWWCTTPVVTRHDTMALEDPTPMRI